MRGHPRSERFFTPEEKEKLKTATDDVESRTIGQIVVMVVDHSDHYIEAEVLGSVLLGSLLSLILAVLFFDSSLWFYIPLTFIFFFPCWFLFIKVGTLKKLFLGNKRKEEAVRLRAERAFFERGLYRTKKNTGVLFFLSLLERKVWVLADRGIHEKMDQGALDRYADEVSKGVRQGRACAALSQAIQEIGVLLSKHFPVTGEDVEKLPDEVITEE